MKKHNGRGCCTGRLLNDFQAFKGRCEKTMQAFGGPAMTHHEIRLLVKDDLAKLPAGTKMMYAIYRRSENRILEIVETPKAMVLDLAA